MPQHTGTYLDRILADTAAALAARTDLPTAPPEAPVARGFLRALSAPGISLIAEVKKASPSRGVIREDFHPAEIGRTYEQAGASAISVLTDEKYFQGKLAYLEEVRAVTTIPLLRKDFIIHPAQIYEAVGRADAVLLIVAALEKSELADFLTLATACGLDTLVEVHDRAELEIALAVGAPVIGINNRDLRTFVVDLRTTFDLAPAIPEGRLIVSESGIHTAAQVKELSVAGVDAILVGESLMVSEDVPAKVAELLGRGQG
ncbi:MAG: indole-3-glycerol phosphate synthase TrpC [Armatimonadota bacterium]